MKITDSTFGLKEGDLNIILKFLSQYPEIHEGFIFGSRAMGNYKRGSDVDIAIKGSNLQDIVHKVRGQLNDETPLPYKFDVALYDTDNKNLKEHIENFAKKIYPHK